MGLSLREGDVPAPAKSLGLKRTLSYIVYYITYLYQKSTCCQLQISYSSYILCVIFTSETIYSISFRHYTSLSMSTSVDYLLFISFQQGTGRDSSPYCRYQKSMVDVQLEVPT